jgi:hypothetical protein
MTEDTSIILRVLKQQAWQRAKGELLSMNGTSYDDPERFRKLVLAINDFIKYMEDEGLDE